MNLFELMASEVPLDELLEQALALARSNNAEQRQEGMKQLYELAYSHEGAIDDEALLTLLDGLQEEDAQIGESALWALGYCQPRSLPGLIEMLAHPRSEVKERAAHALGNIGAPAAPAAPALRRLLSVNPAALGQRAVWSLGLIREPSSETLEALLVLAHSAESGDRSASLHALGNLVRSDDAPAAWFERQRAVFDAALTDEDESVRLSALYLLDGMPKEPRSHADRLLRLLADDPALSVREAALTDLKPLAPLVDLSSSSPLLIDQLQRESHLARLACEVLAVLRPAPVAAIAPLHHLLDRRGMLVIAASTLWAIEADASVLLPALQRSFAQYGEEICDLICSMGAAASPLLPQVLEVLAGDDNWDLQWAAADAVAAMASADPVVLETLLATLRHPSPIVCSSAARGLSRLGELAIPALLALLRDDEDQRRAWAAWILGDMGESAAVALPLLRAQLRNVNADGLAHHCAIAIARIALAEEVIPNLIRILHSADPLAPRRAAAQALGLFGPRAEAAIEPLEALLLAEDERLQDAAQEALVYIRSAMH